MKASETKTSEASAHDIEITPEMLEAGVRVLRASGFLEGDLSGDTGLVQLILETALQAPRRGRQKRGSLATK